MPLKDKKQYNAYMNEYMKRRYKERRMLAFDILGEVCIVCGSQNELEIDHADAGEKDIRLNKMWNMAKEKFLKELDKCQVLCTDCHDAKSTAERRSND